MGLPHKFCIQLKKGTLVTTPPANYPSGIAAAHQHLYNISSVLSLGYIYYAMPTVAAATDYCGGDQRSDYWTQSSC